AQLAQRGPGLTRDLERERQYCELCGDMENLLKCGRCRNSFYCSKEHQKQHWKMHKVNCKGSEAKSQVSKRKPAGRQAPCRGIEGQTLPQQNTRAASRNGETIMKGFITSAVSSVYKPGWLNNHTKPCRQTTTRSTPQKLAREYVVPCMTKHGICVVDNFIGGETDQKTDSTKDIRGDKITWIEDDLARHCNGQRGNFTIHERTKVSSQVWLQQHDCGITFITSNQNVRNISPVECFRYTCAGAFHRPSCYLYTSYSRNI
uniref:MYND-type domain-containing protein n=1 Tax=Oncorhynchus mykiss TaxID=8022 RepID=A0A8K9UMQ2_ONCMY